MSASHGDWPHRAWRTNLHTGRAESAAGSPYGMVGKAFFDTFYPGRWTFGTSRIDVDIHGFDAAGAAGNFDAVHHFTWASDLRAEIIEARLWGGVHYRNSTEVGVALGRSVARYDLRHAFRALGN